MAMLKEFQKHYVHLVSEFQSAIVPPLIQCKHFSFNDHQWNSLHFFHTFNQLKWWLCFGVFLLIRFLKHLIVFHGIGMNVVNVVDVGCFNRGDTFSEKWTNDENFVQNISHLPLSHYYVSTWIFIVCMYVCMFGGNKLTMASINESKIK